MNTAWRLAREEFADDAFSGEGARLYGGRWNHKGLPAIYTSECLSLAVLETLVHLKPIDLAKGYVYFKIEIPEEVAIHEIPPSSLPDNWRDVPSPESTKDIGTEWLKSGETALLKVPSVIVPVEFNYIFNPLHPDFKKIKIGSPETFTLDPIIT